MDAANELKTLNSFTLAQHGDLRAYWISPTDTTAIRLHFDNNHGSSDIKVREVEFWGFTAE